MRRAQWLGRYSAVTQLVFSSVLAGFASLHAEPGFVSRGAVLLVTFSLPGLVGWIGVRARRPALVGAAAVTSAIGAFIAFSGVTLIFLLPALMFFVSALLLVIPAQGEPGGGVVSGAGHLIVAVAICALIMGAGASALLVTDSGCWIVHQTAFGSSIEARPWSTGEMTLAGDATSGGCSTGIMSPLGVGLGAVLAIAALGLAVVDARRRGTRGPGPPLAAVAG